MKNAVKKINDDKLLDDLKKLIEESRRFVALTVNSSMTLLFWKIGNRINQDILFNKRAEYGRQIVVTVSRHLTAEYGNSLRKNYEKEC
ncbi:DUF1016 N-terminal domain-containing protein [Melioribacter sp. Ez-97]|uniref:DUF1016 N-terminal domain-containing protein n=1 Tax=Melioribacter sp. Ez-97 TaxID=3423434 RepID=UPI003ED8F06E